MRLIDADALEVFVKTVRQGLYLDKTLSDIPTRDSMLLNFQQYVHLQPTIEAVPVVRCGECEYGRPDDNAFGFDGITPLIRCSYMTEPNRPHEYCSWGRRKDGGKP